jgi:hypothetical protein
MAGNLNPIAFGTAGAIVAAVIMLLLGILGNLGIYTGAAEMMREWHLFFSLSLGGIIMGTIEAAVISFSFLWLFAWLYNRFLRR